MKIKSLIILAVILATSFQVDAQRRDRKAMFESPYNIEIIPLGVGTDGNKLVKVWATDKKVDRAMVKAEKFAVMAVLFKGIPAGNGAAKTPAICQDADCLDKNKDFFETFFEPGGKYMQFVIVTNDGMPGGKDRVRIKSGYKVAIKASVAYNNLRDYMEDKGMAKSLDAGF
jgi:hypothetical protein